MVDLDAGMLDTMREPSDQMIGVIGIDLANEFQPTIGTSSVAGHNGGRTKHIQAHCAWMFDPSAFRYDLVHYFRRFAWCPSHLHRASELIEPCRGTDLLTVLWIGRRHQDPSDLGVDAGLVPHPSGGAVKIL